VKALDSRSVANKTAEDVFGLATHNRDIVAVYEEDVFSVDLICDDVSPVEVITR